MRVRIKGQLAPGNMALLVLHADDPGMATNRIRMLRKARGLTLEDLAARIGMTDGNLSKLERGQIGYTQSTLESIARELGCRPVDLIIDDPAETKRERALLDMFRGLSPEEQEKFLKIAAALAEPTSPSNTDTGTGT